MSNNYSNYYTSSIQGSHNDGILIKAPDALKSSEQDTITTTIYIDSRDRDATSYPNTNDYVVDLENDYKDVLSLELTACDIHKTEYNVNTNTNKLYVQHTNAQVAAGTFTTVTLTPGNYNITDLLTELKTQIDTALSVAHTITVDSKTRKIKIAQDVNTEAFALVLEEAVKYRNTTKKVHKSGSIGRMLGFHPTNKTASQSGGLNYITADGVYLLENEDYVILHIDEAPRTEGTSDAFIDAFARISFGGMSYGSIKQVKVSDFGSKCIKIYKPLNPRISKLRIRFYRQDGQLYDFNGADNSIALELKQLYQTGKYFL